MTIGELIAELSQYPATDMVVVRGYEGGYDDPNPHGVVLVVDGNWAEPINDNEGNAFKAISYYGRHDDMTSYPEDYTGFTSAICL